LQLKIIEFETDKKIIEEELHQLDTNLSTLRGLAGKESTINEKLRALIGKLKESMARKETVCGKDVFSLEKKYAEMEEFYTTQIKEYEQKKKELDKGLKEVPFKRINLEKLLREIKLYRELLNILEKASIAGFVTGIILFIYGVCCWKRRIQRYQDRILKWEAEERGKESK
jgi:capsule polysaccharide export protein KpsE/RkpR